MPSRIGWIVVLAVVVACGGKKDQDRPGPDIAKPAPVAVPKVDAKTTAFWAWFVAHADALRADKDVVKTMETIGAELEKAHPGVFAEIGADGDNRMLVLSVDGKKDLFPAVLEIFAARPTVSGWSIVAFRQRAKPGDQALNIDMGGKKIAPTDLRFVATPAGGKLDVVVYIPGYTTDEEMGSLGFVLLDHMLGEYDVETKIGAIEFHPLTQAPRDAKPFPELPKMVDALK